MQTILIVDDEELFTRSLIEGLSSLEPSWTVLMAPNGEAALQLLRTRPVSLVITDLKMPGMDGFQLLAHLARNNPELPVIVMSAFATPEIEEQLQASGIDQILEKPLDLPAFHGRVRQILEASAEGHIQGISLPTFLQMIEMEQKTCTITVRSRGQAGTLLFRNGLLVDATAPGLHGHKAVLQLLTWTGADLEIRNTCRLVKRAIHQSLQHLLLESMVHMDERPGLPAGGPAPKGGGGGAPVVIGSPIEPLAGLEGFNGMALVDDDGTLLRAWPENRALELARAADSGRRIASAAGAACARMALGRSTLVQLEGPEGQAFIRELATAAGGNRFLFLAMDPEGQAGLARMKLLALEG